MTRLVDEPMVARWGSEHPAAPLVVVLHGNGTSEHSMIEISPWLPHGPVAYAAVRAPLPAERGYAWFDDPDELPTTTEWLLRWLDDEGDRSVLLLAFRSGVTVAGALLLAAPERFSGAVLLHGALPSRSLRPGVLRGIPVFLADAAEDPHLPAEQRDRTWDWMRRESGAPVRVARTASSRQLAGEIVGDAGSWLGDRLDHLHSHGENPLPDGPEPEWPGLGRLPSRAGGAPDTTPTLPQLPLDPDPWLDPALLTELWARLGTGRTAPAAIGPPGTRSVLADTGPFVDPAIGERAHLHPDGSLHLALPPALAYDAVLKGWAVPHPLAGVRLDAGVVLVPAPRDAAELEVVAGIAAG
ncbi:phospholipase [Pseudonocardia xishanensis]|uniref:Luciferase domain-containing protein n=1 Tax=Pseudonocardia xishanensis TaxID=630995 RepID=A0ABP8RWW5_9PSEU